MTSHGAHVQRSQDAVRPFPVDPVAPQTTRQSNGSVFLLLGTAATPGQRWELRTTWAVLDQSTGSRSTSSSPGAARPRVSGTKAVPRASGGPSPRHELVAEALGGIAGEAYEHVARRGPRLRQVLRQVEGGTRRVPAPTEAG
jgi:hypothetical protein